MESSSPDASASARKIERIILKRLASVGQSCIAEQLGVDESTVSRWKDKKADGKPGDIERFSKFIALLGLKATPVEYKCYDQKTLDAMLTFAKQRMDQIQGTQHLEFEDDE